MISKSTINTSSFLYRQDDDGIWIALHPDLGLVTANRTKRLARKDLIDVILAHVQFAVENDNWEYLYKPTEPSELKGFKSWDNS